MKDLSLLFRWSWRDLRANWAKVAAIALVIAIGTGGYAGLTSQANWRRASYDASYEHLAMYDVRVKLATGSAVEQGILAATAATIEHADSIAATASGLSASSRKATSTTSGRKPRSSMWSASSSTSSSSSSICSSSSRPSSSSSAAAPSSRSAERPHTLASS